MDEAFAMISIRLVSVIEGAIAPFLFSRVDAGILDWSARKQPLVPATLCEGRRG